MIKNNKFALFTLRAAFGYFSLRKLNKPGNNSTVLKNTLEEIK